MLLHRRSLIAVYLAFGALASFRRRHQSSVVAIWCDHAVEPGQVNSGLRHQDPNFSAKLAADLLKAFKNLLMVA